MSLEPQHTAGRPILHVLAPAREGGVEKVVAMLSAAQMRLGVHVAAVITPDEAQGHPFVHRLEALGVPVTRIIVDARNYVNEYRELSALITSIKPRLLHTHGYRADLIGGQLGRSRRIPTVSTVHGFTGGGRRNRFYEWIQRIALRRASAVIAVSKPLAQNLVRAGIQPAKIHVVPNGFTALPAISRAAARDRLGIAGDQLVAGWVGRLSREKGADVMIDAFSQLDASWRLSIIGDGPELGKLQIRAETLGVADRIAWHGLIENAGSLLTAFDAFVLSSRTEGTPIGLFEAMHAGVPIVATRVGGVPDVINSEHAIIVASESPDMIARALADIATDRVATGARIARARERLQAFSSAEWSAAIAGVYDAASTNYAK